MSYAAYRLLTVRCFRQDGAAAIVRTFQKNLKRKLSDQAVTPGPHAHFPAKWNPVRREKMRHSDKVRVLCPQTVSTFAEHALGGNS
jgi:hypothetical protein